MKIVLCFSG